MLVGPTGTGKSRVAVLVAQALGGEIVGCDALQVYRGLDAATAKPTEVERAGVPHWLIDVADPRQDYSVADYVRAADAAIASIRSRGRVPVVVGGTGMYLRGLLKGLVAAPARDPALRARLRALVARHGPERLHRRLSGRDPASAARIPPRDTQRIVRAWEVVLDAGATWGERLEAGGTWSRGPERYAAIKFGLDADRALLKQRLAARVEAFFAAGLVDEVGRLLSEGVPPEANAFKAIGYREVLRARADGHDPREVLPEVVQATARYAKRQRTWFRREPGVRWIDASADAASIAATIVAAYRAARAG